MPLSEKPHLIGAVIASTMAMTAAGATGASAITADVAKKCDALVRTAFPPRQIGNPAAGSKNGSAATQRDYFKKCVDNGGNMDPPAETPK
jgi:hypothetical protein